MNKRSSLWVICLALVIPSSLGLLYGFVIGPASLVVKQHHIELPSWPDKCSDYRIAVLADLHTGSPFNGIKKLKKIVKTTNKLAPNLIVLPGDFLIQGVVGGRFISPEDIAKELAKLISLDGVYAVLGNHDWWYGAERTRIALESAGIPVLSDKAIELNNDNCRFWLVGISDYLEGPHDYRSALSTVPATAHTIGITHNPDIFPQLPSDILLTIAGHTHGGQVYIPFLGRPIVPSDHHERYAVGHVIEQNRHLFISPGLGTSILPIRFLVPPEISVLALTGKLQSKNPTQ